MSIFDDASNTSGLVALVAVGLLGAATGMLLALIRWSYLPVHDPNSGAEVKCRESFVVVPAQAATHERLCDGPEKADDACDGVCANLGHTDDCGPREKADPEVSDA
jgi:hypothetical protein